MESIEKREIWKRNKIHGVRRQIGTMENVRRTFELYLCQYTLVFYERNVVILILFYLDLS